MSQEFAVGQRVGDYEILAVLGAGGMGKVYKVRNVLSDRIEAMKVLLSNLTGQKELADRFLREIKLLASLNHPNIATLRTALTFENQLVMIMEYVEGVTFASRLQNGPIPAPDAVNYIDQILAALGYAHRQNIVHRDVKPANMMLTPKGVVKLMDFGIARSASDRGLTMTGTTLGSLNYMPPEQVKGEAADARSDLYSLGVSLYEMVCGRLPFQGDSSYSLMAAHLNEVPKPPSTYRSDLPAALDQITLLALSKDPKQRFQSADAFRAALKSVAFPVAKTMPGPPAYAPLPRGSSATALFQEKAAPGANDQLFASTPQVLQQAVAPSSSRRERGQRGLYIALGALLALVVLFAAGLYLPRRTSTRADGDKGGAAASQTSPAQSSASTSDTGPAPSSAMSSSSTLADADGANPSANSSAGPNLLSNTSTSDTTGGLLAPKGSKGKRTASGHASSGAQPESTQNDFPQQGAAQDQAVPSNQPQSADPAQLQELEKQADQLSSRASAVSQSLDSLRAQQAAQGLVLRGDMASSQERMNTYLSKGQAALQRQDAINAKKYFDLTEVELGKLEKFLGH